MDQLIWMLIGASGFAALILMRLAAKHGAAWVQAQMKARASAAEAEFRAKVTAAAGDLGARLVTVEAQVKALPAVAQRLAQVESDLAGLKQKAGL